MTWLPWKRHGVGATTRFMLHEFVTTYRGQHGNLEKVSWRKEQGGTGPSVLCRLFKRKKSERSCCLGWCWHRDAQGVKCRTPTARRHYFFVLISEGSVFPIHPPLPPCESWAPLESGSLVEGGSFDPPPPPGHTPPPPLSVVSCIPTRRLSMYSTTTVGRTHLSTVQPVGLVCCVSSSHPKQF